MWLLAHTMRRLYSFAPLLRPRHVPHKYGRVAHCCADCGSLEHHNGLLPYPFAQAYTLFLPFPPPPLPACPKTQEILHDGPLWVKVIHGGGALSHVDWSPVYNALRQATGTNHPGSAARHSALWAVKEETNDIDSHHLNCLTRECGVALPIFVLSPGSGVVWVWWCPQTYISPVCASGAHAGQTLRQYSFSYATGLGGAKVTSARYGGHSAPSLEAMTSWRAQRGRRREEGNRHRKLLRTQRPDLSPAPFPCPSYLLHEAVAWSPYYKRWFFLPRRASRLAYDDQADETRGRHRTRTCENLVAEFDVCVRECCCVFSTLLYLSRKMRIAR